MLLALHLLAACADDPADSGSVAEAEARPARFGYAEGDCPEGGESVHVDVGSDVAIVSGDSRPDDGARCEPLLLRRSEPGSSVWSGSCPDGDAYSIAWVVPA